MPTRAFAPGSITGLFAPAPPGTAGASRGASFAIDDGVVVRIIPDADRLITVDSEPAPFDPVERVLDDLGVTAAIDIQPDVPLGHGFGASGAATLATALAANEEFELGRPRDELLAAAHQAEMAAGTGQGDVFIQERGGLLWTGEEGVRRVEPPGVVEYTSTAGIETASMLADDEFMETARRIGQQQLDALAAEPDLESLAERGREYVRETGIGTEFVEREIERVESVGGTASMALFGETVFAVGVDGVLSNRCTVSSRGARVLSSET